MCAVSARVTNGGCNNVSLYPAFIDLSFGVRRNSKTELINRDTALAYIGGRNSAASNISNRNLIAASCPRRRMVPEAERTFRLTHVVMFGTSSIAQTKNSSNGVGSVTSSSSSPITTQTRNPKVKKRKTKKKRVATKSPATTLKPSKPKVATKRKTRTPKTSLRSKKVKETKKISKTKKLSSMKKEHPKDEPAHFYRNVTDVITIISNEESGDGLTTAVVESKIVRFKVRGNPVPLARHRSYRGFIFNPSAKKQKQFCDVVLDMLPLSYFHFQSLNANNTIEGITVPSGYETANITKGIDNVIPIFQHEVISVQIISRMKRPNKHFVANKPGPGRLRQPPSNLDSEGNAIHPRDRPAYVASHLQVTRTDVDNLAKFVLDSLNGVLYTDDRQVASLTVTKVYDDEEPFTGSTDVIIKSMTMDDLNGVL